MKLLIHFILFALFVTQIQSNPIANTETTDSSLSNTKIVPDDPKTDSLSFHNNIPFSSFPNNIGLKGNTTCPPPLILYTEENAPGSCLPNGCCLPCPVVETFYKENMIKTIYSVLSIVRVISFTCILVVVISYLVLPNKRDRPALTVLLFNVSLLIFIGVTFFYIGDHKRVQCYNEVIQSTMENNPVYCGAQGLILIFSTFHLILWCFLLILHLHCQTVWRSNILQHYYIHSHVFIWTMAIAFTVLNGVTKSISFEFGVVCLVSSKYAETYFWFPLAGFVMLGFLIHTWTVWHITKSHWIVTKTSLSEKDTATTSITTATTNLSSPTICANNTNYLARQEIIRILKIQWRALLLAVIFLITYSFYWAYVRIEFPKLETLYDNGKPAWLLNWLSCILSGKGQNFCSQISMPNIPNVIFLVVAEFFTGSAGIWVFIVFGTSINLWTEWRVYLANKFSSQKVLTRSNNA